MHSVQTTRPKNEIHILSPNLQRLEAFRNHLRDAINLLSQFENYTQVLGTQVLHNLNQLYPDASQTRQS